MLLQEHVCGAILHYYASQLEQKGIKYRYSVEVPEKMKISDLDICRIFGNLMENAVRAVQKEENADEAYVNCICKVKMGKLLINIENTYGRRSAEKWGSFLFIQVTAGRELELLLFPKQQRNMVDMPTFLPETVYSGRMCLFHWKIWIYGFLDKAG